MAWHLQSERNPIKNITWVTLALFDILVKFHRNSPNIERCVSSLGGDSDTLTPATHG